MFKPSYPALAILAILASSRGVDAACTSGTIATLAAGASCTYDNFVAALSADCAASIADLFLNEATGLPLDEAARRAEVEALCEYDAPTQFVEIQGSYQDDRRYFAGGSDLVDGSSSWNVLSGKIKRFEANLGTKTVIAFPEYAARIDYNSQNNLGANGYPANMNLEKSCSLNTIMCCFTDASISSFAANADATTDVCRHDLRDSPQSNHIANGWSVFPGAETPTHCVGFTWNDGEEELLGNMMYEVSLRQTATKGYRQGVPGAPMCGCVEHMPVVESAKCRTAVKDPAGIVYSFQYNEDSGYVSASNTVAITYQDCANADLAAQYKANHADDVETAALIDEHLVGAGNCDADLEEYLNDEQFLLEGQHPRRYAQIDHSVWSDLVVGEGIRFLPPNPDPIVADTAFRALIEAGCKNADGTPRYCMVRRFCDSCPHDSHIDIYYKRKTTLPPMGTNTTNGEVYFLDLFMNQWTSYKNILNTDFELYSNYQDALNGVNKWMACNYDSSGVGFPRDCGPRDTSVGEWNSYTNHNWFERANHHGFYVEKPSA
ncbi:hypothetical protein ACHAWU_002671 [Discostella pseudostelligera]|uniref:Uncharacterized protein n=1 Tax=Discostella pseudostelligera TaxID=259834 RepID=A0ABD3MX10_9STRA